MTKPISRDIYDFGFEVLYGGRSFQLRWKETDNENGLSLRVTVPFTFAEQVRMIGGKEVRSVLLVNGGYDKETFRPQQEVRRYTQINPV